MNMKKILALCIVALMTLEAGGCGAGSTALGSAANNKDESDVSSEVTAVTDESVSAQDTSVAADESILAQSPESADGNEFGTLSRNGLDLQQVVILSRHNI